MTANVAEPQAAEVDLPERVRRVVRALISMKGLSVQAAADEADLTYNTFREHLNGKNGELGISELDAVGPVVGVTAGEILLIAEGAREFPLRAKRELELLPGGAKGTKGIQNRPLLHSVRAPEG